MKVLLTGGMGYLGSHTALSLLEQGHEVTIFDNLSNSNASVLENIANIASGKPNFVHGNILDTSLVKNTIDTFKIEAVIHLAGLKAVGESVLEPLMYYQNNVQGTISLLDAMLSCNIGRLVFSSSATVYGIPQYLPLDEEHPINPYNPYGNSKFFIEQMLRDIANSNKDWAIVNLRYFNPVGSHISGLIGDNPKGIPNNLMPYINQVAANQRPFLNVFGGDYETPDGTGVRDFIHVEDLSEAHLAALNLIKTSQKHGDTNMHTLNIGTGVGYSVLNIIRAYERVNDLKIPYEITARREGDIAACYANPTKANTILGWKASRTLEDMCGSAWNFQKNK
ncbi:UDP-glucose 4-epimerase GalE [Gammaproteobacteria bacterium]|nr:UDP-glucose 4-epimerase GalE [Gammaproteobacteria bacterium]